MQDEGDADLAAKKAELDESPPDATVPASSSIAVVQKEWGSEKRICGSHVSLPTTSESQPQWSAIPVPTQDEGGAEMDAKRLKRTEAPPDVAMPDAAPPDVAMPDAAQASDDK